MISVCFVLQAEVQGKSADLQVNFLVIVDEAFRRPL